MTHQPITQDGRVEAISASVETDVSKAMAMVFKDAQLVDLVFCYTTLWASCDHIMANANPNDPAPVISIVFDGIGNPFAKAYSFQLSSEGWCAMGFQDEDRFTDWLPVIGLLTEDDDAGQAATN